MALPKRVGRFECLARDLARVLPGSQTTTAAKMRNSRRSGPKNIGMRQERRRPAHDLPRLRPMTEQASSLPKSDSSLRVRVATEGDSARLIPLINSAYSIETFLEGTRTDEVRLASMMRKGNVLVAEAADSSGQLLGCVYTEVRGERGYLGQLAVDPAYKSARLGRMIVEAAEDHLRRQGCVAVDITVLSMRTELPPIYRRFGYVETGIEEFHPTQPLKSGVECHSIVMSKQL